MMDVFLCLFLADVLAVASPSRCGRSETSLEKTLGFRPPVSTPSRLLYEPPPGSPRRPITAECVAKCGALDECDAFALLYGTSRCYSYGNLSGVELIQDEDAATFSKVCLKGPACDKLWSVERIPGATLIGNDTRALPGLRSRADCAQACRAETRFACRSAKFRRAQRGALGACTLSDADRHTLPNAYRVSGFDEEYLENECAKADRHAEKGFCGYEEYDNVTLAHGDVLLERMGKKECEKMCDEFKGFNCRGFSVVRGNMCYLHSEDSKVFGPSLLTPNAMSVYYEKAKCLNISVHCSESYITVRYDPEELNFSGRIYMSGHSDDPACYATGSGRHDVVTLKVPLLTGDCGFIKADGPFNRTLLSSSLTIQYNPIIQTQNDRVIRVGCVFGNETKVVVGTGVTVTPSGPNKGTTFVDNSTAVVTSPLVEMRIVDLNTNGEVSDTQIGEELQLVIRMTKDPARDFDIRAGHLVAMTDKGDESIFLLDDQGCPTDLNIFPPLRKLTTGTTVELIANFQAFKFASSPIVRFSVIVQFCARECPEINCGQNIVSNGKSKREIVSSAIQTVNGTKVIETNRSNIHERGLVNNMPLEYIMVVRDPKSTSDRLVFGDHKILIAGYDYSTNEVCMDYSLVIGLIILWALIQVIFIIGCIILVRRYKRYYQHECMRQSLEVLHKNFGLGFSNLENRRVHWEDT